MEEASTLLLLPLVILVLVVVICTRKYVPCRINAIPKTYPVIGCLVSFYSNRKRLLLDWYTELLSESPSGTVVIERLAGRRTVVTANPWNVEYILKTKFDNFPKGKAFREILGDFLGNGIFNVDGELWVKQRRLATHEFTPRSLREYVTVLRKEIDHELLPSLDSAAQPLDLQELLRRFTFNMVCIVFLGMDHHRCTLNPSTPVSEFDRAFQTASAVSAGRGSAPLSFLWKLKRRVGYGSERDLKNAVREVHRCVDEIIRAKNRTEITTNTDFLSRLIAAGESHETVRDMVISIVMAGRDTTSAVVTRFFWLITGRQETQRELVDEIRRVKERTPGGFDYQSLKKLSLLKACLCEAMRLYPPVPWDSKHALTHDRLPDGTPVRAGDRVTYFPYGMGRMEELWGPDWDEFNPNRWFHSYGQTRVFKKVNPFKFTVFQAGPRVCLGEEMAYVQMKYVVASILDRFQIEPIGTDKPVFVPMLTAHMPDGMQVRVRRRDLSP